MSELESLSSNHIEAIRQNLNIDWRAEKPVFDDQMTYFCLKEEMADVEFVFNRNNEITKISAHSLPLSVASEVFQKELSYSSENEKKKRFKILQVIEVKDDRVEIDALRTTLLFIYNAYKNVDFTDESALDVLYIAMKYMIKPLEHLCISYLLNNLNAENASTIFQFCTDYQIDEWLEANLMEFIRDHTEAVLKAESFPKISHECLTLLLELDSLNVTEVHLFEAVIRWAQFACEKSGEDPKDGKNLRAKLGPALRLIRFPAMSMEEFRKSVVAFPIGILNLEEQRDVMFMIHGTDPVGSLISTIATPRQRNRYVVSMNVLKQSSYTFTKTKLSLLIRIDQFPAFVTSEEGFRTSRDIIINNTSWYWYIGIRLRNQSKTYLATYLTGSGIIKKDSSFDVEAKFKFKHHPTAKEQVATEKFSFNSSNGYKSFGHPRKLAPIDDLLDPQKGYLVDNALELFLDITITESE